MEQQKEHGDFEGQLEDAIRNADDRNFRTIFVLLQAMYRSLAEEMRSLREVELSKIVLNGHEADHSKHHDWIAEQIAAADRAREDGVKLKQAGKESFVRQAVSSLLGGAFTLLAVLVAKYIWGA